MISTALLVLVVRAVWGPAAGMLAGLFYAAVAPLPGLVAWASGSQDLLAITFFLAALLLRQRGRLGWSVLAAAAGLLSKESILVAWPVLIFWDELVGRERTRARHALLGFGGIALAWMLLHPGLHVALAPPVPGDMPRYVGFRNLAVSSLHLRGYLGALVNVPVAAPVSGLSAPLVLSGILAMMVGGVGFLAMRLRPATDPGTAPDPRPTGSLTRAVIVALLIAIPGVILPSLVINRWVAYYGCLPALGSALLLGVIGSRMPLLPALVLVLAWTGLGVYSRGMDASDGILNERSFVEGGRAIRKVEEGFRELHPSLPHGSQVLVSVASSGMLGIHGTLVDGQAPRLWYGDRSLRTLPPERRLAGRPEILVRITSDQGVVEILPDSLTHRSAGRASADERELRMVVRTYARGLAATGEHERAAGILELLARRDGPLLRSQDLRLAAMALRVGGAHARAESLLAEAPPIPRDVAIDAIARVLSQPTRRPEMDSLAYWAFGVPADDPEALRTWMAMFYGSEFYAQALHMAERLHAVLPDDSESEEVARQARVRLRFTAVRD